MKDIIIDTLVVEEDREAHIAKHNITINEVLEVLTGDYILLRGEMNGGYLLERQMTNGF